MGNMPAALPARLRAVEYAMRGMEAPYKELGDWRGLWYGASAIIIAEGAARIEALERQIGERGQRMRMKTYDIKCGELADHFLKDEPTLAGSHLRTELALTIQEAIEDWFASKRLGHETTSANSNNS